MVSWEELCSVDLQTANWSLTEAGEWSWQDRLLCSLGDAMHGVCHRFLP